MSVRFVRKQGVSTDQMGHVPAQALNNGSGGGGGGDAFDGGALIALRATQAVTISPDDGGTLLTLTPTVNAPFGVLIRTRPDRTVQVASKAQEPAATATTNSTTVYTGCAYAGDATYACGWSRQSSGVEIYNTDGSVGATLLNAFSFADFCFWVKFDLNGNVVWAKQQTWTGTPGSLHDNQLNAVEVIDGRLFFAGGHRSRNAPDADFGNGVTYAKTATYRVEGTYRLEVDPTTGDALNIAINDADFPFVLDSRNTSVIDDAIYIAKSPSNSSYIVSNHCGDGTTFPIKRGLTIGKGHPSSFVTRQMAGGQEENRVCSYISEIGLDGTPLRVVTQRGDLNLFGNSRAFAGRPAILNAGVAWCFLSAGNAGIANDTDRDPTTYGTLGVASSDVLNIQVMDDSFNTPIISKTLCDNTSFVSDFSLSAHLRANKNKTAIFAAIQSGFLTNLGTSRSLRVLETGPNVNLPLAGSLLTAMDAATGARLWLAQFTQANSSAPMRLGAISNVASGVNANKIVAPLIAGKVGNNPYGPRNASDNLLGFDFASTWTTAQGGVVDTLNISVWTESGDVIASDCFALGYSANRLVVTDSRFT